MVLENLLDPRFIDKDIEKRKNLLNKELNELLIEKEEWDNVFSQNNNKNIDISKRPKGKIINENFKNTTFFE